MELRPDHWSTTLKSHLETSRNYVLTTRQTYTNSQVTDTYIIHRNLIPSFVTNPYLSYVESIPTRHFQPWVKSFSSHQSHATGLPTIMSIVAYVKLVTTYIHIFNLSSIIHIKIMSNSWFTHKTLSQSYINIPIKPSYNNLYKYQLNIQAQRDQIQDAFSLSSSLRLEDLAQARRTLAQSSSLRLGESSKHTPQWPLHILT